MIKFFPKAAFSTRSVNALGPTLLALILSVFSLAGFAGDSVLKPYEAKYRISQNGLSADATRSLSKVGPHWRLSQTASKWFVTIGEESLMEVTADQQVRPLQYRYENSLSSKRDQRIVFDWAAGTVADKSYQKPYSMPLKKDYSDQLSSQLQLRQRLLSGKVDDQWQQTIVKNGKLKTYQIEKLGEETLETELGKIETVKLRRARKGSSAETVIWLAKNWDYMIVRLQQSEDDDTLSLELVSAKLDGKTLTGK